MRVLNDMEVLTCADQGGPSRLDTGELEGAPRSRRVRVSSRRATGRRTAKQLVGEAAEDIAAEFLRTQGLEVLERNYRRRLGELDIVARDPHSGVLVIAEVRARASDRSAAEGIPRSASGATRGDRFGGAAASVDFRKRQRLVRAAHQLLQQRCDLARMPVRFDVICVSDVGSNHPRVDWIRQAFYT